MSVSFESRYLGEMQLDGGLGGAVTTGSVSYSGAELPVRVEVDFPDEFSTTILNDIDMVIDNLEFVDGLALKTIAAGVQRDSSSAAKLFRSWASTRGGRSEDVAEFLAALTPAHLSILPDGGLASPVRVLLTYELRGGSSAEQVKVRFLEPSGPELVPA